MSENEQDKLSVLVTRVAKVKLWLLAIAALKVAAVCMLFVCGYIGIYIWLDNRLNFSSLDRIAGFVLLILGTGILLYELLRRFGVHVSYTDAAGYIENKNSFDQQLAAAMEYYEKRADYPYSEALAEQLVSRVLQSSETFKFESVVKKWHGYLLVAVIVLGLSIVGFFVWFEASKFFPEAGISEYRFEAGSAAAGQQNVEIGETPEIKSITAEISLPPSPLKEETVRNYAEQVVDNTLKLLAQSTVKLNVQATDKLSKVEITGLDGQSSSEQLDGADLFTYTFTADRSGSVGLRLIGEKGLVNENIPDLKVLLRTDEPPEFKLIWPDGDNLATNVASVPIEFVVTDDFGLSSMQLCLELPGQQPVVMDFPVEPGSKERKLDYIVELEQYDLDVGDCIVFYAQATDVKTGITARHVNTRSDIYFIEIRSYQQYWKPQAGGGPSNQSGGAAEDLLNVLEYTRAIIKKTWAFADKPVLAAQDYLRIDSISDDVDYCTELLTEIRNDSDYGFSDIQKDVLNEVLRYYKQAGECLHKREVSPALESEKNAYRVLRKFILELVLNWSPPPSGQGQQPQKPDSVKLKESPEFAGYEKERIEDELKKMQQNVEKLKGQQRRLKTDFEHFLEQQNQTGKKSQNEADEKSISAAGEKQKTSEGPNSQQQSSASSAKSSQAGSNKQGGSSSGNKESQQGQAGSEAKSGSASGSSSESRQAGKTGDTGQKAQESATGSEDVSRASRPRIAGWKPATQGQDSQSSETGSGKGQEGQGNNLADPDARMKMFQARQAALQKDVSQLNQDLENLSRSSELPAAQASGEAQKHLEQAIQKMGQFQERVNQSQYEAEPFGKKAAEAVELLDSAESKLSSAQDSLEQGLTKSDEQRFAKQAQEMAEQLAQDAAALDESLTAVEKQDMLARLEAAKRLLESMAGAQWTTVSKGSSGGGAAHVYTKDPYKAADTASEISRQFWSIYLNSKKRDEQTIIDEPSDVRFYEAENKFFENAAKYNQRPDKK